MFDAEDAVRAVVERLTILECILSERIGDMAQSETLNGVERILGDTLTDARAVAAAWDAEYSAGVFAP